MKLPTIPADKANHVIYGALAFCASGVLGAAPVESLAAVIALGIAKEAADWLANWVAVRKGRPAVHGVEVLDAVATAVGGLLCFVATKVHT